MYINTLGVKMDATGDELSATGLANECASWFATEYRACLPTRLTLDTLTMRRMPEPSTEVGVKGIALAGTVAEGGDFLPLELACTLSWKTNHAGRSGRGHIALPVPHVTSLMNSVNTYDSSKGLFTTNIPAFFAKLDDGHDWGVGGIGGHLSHIVYSRKNNAGYDVTARLIRYAPRWQQRRQTAP